MTERQQSWLGAAALCLMPPLSLMQVWRDVGHVLTSPLGCGAGVMQAVQSSPRCPEAALGIPALTSAWLLWVLLLLCQKRPNTLLSLLSPADARICACCSSAWPLGQHFKVGSCLRYGVKLHAGTVLSRPVRCPRFGSSTWRRKK